MTRVFRCVIDSLTLGEGFELSLVACHMCVRFVLLVPAIFLASVARYSRASLPVCFEVG